MTKKEYKQFRKLLRANGEIAFRWWPASIMLDRLQDLYNQRDPLEERKTLVHCFRYAGILYNFRHLRNFGNASQTKD